MINILKTFDFVSDVGENEIVIFNKRCFFLNLQSVLLSICK